MVSKIVCIFFRGHLYLWKDVPLSAELQDKWTWKGIFSPLKGPYEELENAWNNELNFFFQGKVWQTVELCFWLACQKCMSNHAVMSHLRIVIEAMQKPGSLLSRCLLYSLSFLPENWRTENMREKWKSFWHFLTASSSFYSLVKNE